MFVKFSIRNFRTKLKPKLEYYITDVMYDEIFNESIGKLVIHDLPLQLVVVNLETMEVQQWIPPGSIEKS